MPSLGLFGNVCASQVMWPIPGLLVLRLPPEPALIVYHEKCPGSSQASLTPAACEIGSVHWKETMTEDGSAPEEACLPMRRRWLPQGMDLFLPAVGMP